MKVVVLGASGGCGKALVQQAIARGYDVTAVVRASSKLDVTGVRVLRGDLTDVAFLRTAVHGADVVFSALGMRLQSLAPWAKGEDPTFLSRSTPALVAALKAEGVQRLVAISAGGVGDSLKDMPGMFRLFIAATALRHAYVELDAMERTMIASGLDVCICRPTGLTDGPKVGGVHVNAKLKGRATISRADVAAWMLNEAEKPGFAHVTPVITVTGAA
jgi:putative NADH-flavin reductase